MQQHTHPVQNQNTDFQFSLPPWVLQSIQHHAQILPDREERMRLTIELARQNVIQGDGGPFAAAVFHAETHRLISAGVNLVLSQRWPAGHAEIVAMTLAQRTLDAQDSCDAPMELVTSCEPCMMCMGASLWFGIKRIVIGAPGTAAEAIGFDEGPKPEHWVQAFQQRHIEVIRDVLYDEASAVFHSYAQSNGLIYNAGQME